MKEVVSTIFLGMPLVAWGGIVTLTLVVFQVLIGSKVIKVNFKYHRIGGFVILGVAILHATAALIYILG